MLWAIASSVVVIYLYRQLNAPSTSAATSRGAQAGTVEAEIAALNAQIAALESKIAGSGDGDVKP